MIPTRPTITVNDALRLALPLGSSVAGGRAGLGARVSWAQVVRGRSLSLTAIEPGELLIFAPEYLGLLGGERDQARLVRQLAAAGASAFAQHQQPSPLLVELADELATPLITLPGEAVPEEVVQTVVSLRHDRDEQVRTRLGEVHERLLAVLLEEDGSRELARVLARATHKATYILDSFLQVTAAESAAAEVETPVLRSRLLELLGEAGSADRARWVLNEVPGGRAMALARGLELRGARAGFLCLVGAREEFSEFDERLAESAAPVVTIELAKQRTAAEARFRLQSELLHQLLRGEPLDEREMGQRARRLGYDLQQPHLAAALEVMNSEGEATPSTRQQEFLELTRLQVLRTDPSALLHERSGRLLMLRRVPDLSAETARSMVESLRRGVAEALRTELVVAGVGRPATEVSRYARSAQEAEMALEVARSPMGGGGTVHFAELGVRRLLLQLVGNPEVDAYRGELLGELEAYDARHRTELARTLEVFLDCHGNHVRAAASLHLHRNTLLYRLARAQEIMGLDLDDAETRLSVQLALKLRRVATRAHVEAIGGARS